MAKPSINQIAERYELPAQIARQFAKLHSMSPSAARELLSELSSVVVVSANGTTTSTGKPPGSGTPSNYGKLAEWFVASKNRWATKAQIERDTGLSDNSIHTLLYGAHQGSFERGPDPRGGRAKAFRLTAEALSKASGGSS